jgi:hypothetical protein
MTETLDRDELAALLARLGDDDDAAALRAAREAHARVAAAGLSWAALLAPADGADAEDALDVADAADADAAADADDAADADGADEADAADQAGAADEVGAAGAEGAGTDAESLALIGQLLARRDVSQELRDELDGYKADIAAGEFTEADRRYLRAMHRRLSK